MTGEGLLLGAFFGTVLLLSLLLLFLLLLFLLLLLLLLPLLERPRYGLPSFQVSRGSPMADKLGRLLASGDACAGETGRTASRTRASLLTWAENGVAVKSLAGVTTSAGLGVRGGVAKPAGSLSLSAMSARLPWLISSEWALSPPWTGVESLEPTCLIFCDVPMEPDACKISSC